jgi:hypothetical protein
VFQFFPAFNFTQTKARCNSSNVFHGESLGLRSWFGGTNYSKGKPKSILKRLDARCLGEASMNLSAEIIPQALSVSTSGKRRSFCSRRCLAPGNPRTDKRSTNLEGALVVEQLSKNRKATMPRGDKSSYPAKQKRQAEHIEKGYEKSAKGKKEAKRRAWATVNKMIGGGKKSGSGRGKKTNKAPARKGGRIGGRT